MLNRLRPLVFFVMLAMVLVLALVSRVPNLRAQDSATTANEVTVTNDDDDDDCKIGDTSCVPFPATINITKVHNATDDAGRKFKFNIDSDTRTDPKDFKLAGGQTKALTGLDAGVYVIKEKSLGDNFLTNIACTIAVDSAPTGDIVIETDVINRRLVINVGPSDVVNCTFTNEHEAQIVAWKFNDKDNSGGWSAGDKYLKGWEIELWADGNKISDRKTDGDGKARFKHLRPGIVYTVCEVQKDGWTQTFPAANACHEVTPTFGTRVEVMFGNYQSGGGSSCSDDDDDDCDDDDDDLSAADTTAVVGTNLVINPDLLDGSHTYANTLTSDGVTTDDVYPTQADELEQFDATYKIHLPVIIQ